MLHAWLNDDGYVALIGQMRTERNGDTEKGCQKPAVQQKTTNETYAKTVLPTANILV